MLSCCAARRKDRGQNQPHGLTGEQNAANGREEEGANADPFDDTGEEAAVKLWRVKADEDHCAFVHEVSGIVVELKLKSNGWFMCRDPSWKMHTLYPDGRIDTPRVQVFDAEHLITDLRFDFDRECADRSARTYTRNSIAGYLPRFSKVAEGGLGNWEMAFSEQGHVLISNVRTPGTLLVLIGGGFCFVGSRGDAVLVDEMGLSRLGAKEARALLPTAAEGVE